MTRKTALKVHHSTVEYVAIRGNLNVNFKMIAKGNFVYEGFNRNRFLRYNGPTKTYEEVRGYKGGRDIRTHNIDLLHTRIFIENNSSQDAVIEYQTPELARKAFAELVGEDNMKLVK